MRPNGIQPGLQFANELSWSRARVGKPLSSDPRGRALGKSANRVMISRKLDSLVGAGSKASSNADVTSAVLLLGEPAPRGGWIDGHSHLERWISLTPAFEEPWRNQAHAPAPILQDSRPSLKAVIEDRALSDGLLALEFYPDHLNVWVHECFASEVTYYSKHFRRLRLDLHRR